MKSVYWGLVVIGLLGFGCGKDGTTAACNVPSSNACTEYSGDGASQVDETCSDEGGEVVDSCSTTNLAGVCSYSAGTKVFFYVTETVTSASVMQICSASNGTFSAD